MEKWFNFNGEKRTLIIVFQPPLPPSLAVVRLGIYLSMLIIILEIFSWSSLRNYYRNQEPTDMLPPRGSPSLSTGDFSWSSLKYIDRSPYRYGLYFENSLAHCFSCPYNVISIPQNENFCCNSWFQTLSLSYFRVQITFV